MSRLDLSRLPEPLRRKLQDRLDKLPSEIREQLLANLGKVPPKMLEAFVERGSPMLEKLLDRIEAELPASTKPSTTRSSSSREIHSPQITSSGHYNKTVQRGDNLSLRFLVVVILVVGALVLVFRSGLLAE
jgi:hypothetical protein